jgi:hypothetical protein
MKKFDKEIVIARNNDDQYYVAAFMDALEDVDEDVQDNEIVAVYTFSRAVRFRRTPTLEPIKGKKS